MTTVTRGGPVLATQDRALHRAVARRPDDQEGGRDLARAVASELSEALDGLLADDVIFYSPIVYTP